jgi:TonB-linked SusC/RagA family outer membrane protein
MKKNYFFYLFKYGLALLMLTCAINVFAQQSSFTGKVVDENAQPLPGATVSVKGTNQSFSTDSKGEFRITMGQTALTVSVTYVGYDVSERVIIAGQNVNIQLRPNAKALSEVVVVGYGTAKKSDLTGAVTNISNKDFNQGPVTNPLQQLSGRAAGVAITQTGSEPGQAPNIKIRGISSFNGSNNPLVVIDGVQGDVGLLNQISPSEIESVDILKDASATAIYGSRGATGVVIVTMKKGRPGRTSIEYNANTSVDVVTRQLKMFTADEWGQQAASRGIPASSNFGANTDWFGLITRNGITQNHTLALGGGTENFSYRASLGVILQNGIVINSDNQRYNARIEATQKALDNKLTITMTLNNSVNRGNYNSGSIGRAAFTSNLISNAYISRPTDPVYKPDGTYFTDPLLFEPLNVVAAANTIKNPISQNRLVGSVRANLQILPGFSGEVFGSWARSDAWSANYTPAESTLASAISQKGFASVNSDFNDNKLFDAQLSYRKDIGEHHFDVTGVYEWQSAIGYNLGASARGFVNDLALYNNLSLGDFSKVQAGDYRSGRDERRGISLKGRANYSFKNRYLLTASISRDGSTVFGANHKWGNFPSVALAWRVDQESFMKEQKIFSALKFRAGYGETGNQQPIDIGRSQQFVNGSGTVYFAGQLQTNFVVNQNANPDVEWETKKATNLGIDFGFFNNRLTGSFDAYKNTTTKLLYSYTVPQPPFPATNITANIGSFQSRGLELSLNYDVISNSTTRLTLGGNATLMDSKVLSLNGTYMGVPLTVTFPGYGGANGYLVEGMAIGTIRILKHKGVTAAGAETMEDLNGNGSIDAGAASLDRYVAGQNQPKYTFAFTPSFSYKNFDAAMVWRGQGGNKLYNQLRANLSFMENLGKSNLLASSVETNMFTSAYYGTSDYWLESGAFIRLENVSMGYKIPTPKMKYISAFRLSLTGQNLLLITKYKGIDPEETGGDNGIYPRVRTFAMGLNIVLK